ncbi:enhancin-3 [Mocis latipes granulovirus]|uniref:Enhancin-3 n=1 Tax=Mocis latipes granulovirus TaxID=2072024 RepID=A0A162GW74_9BBAC|nr:enhancin-3 [Mocis latipes granulovirus]AKR17469.1 enhancin-3 [Mocis latipes granulovirus]
MSYKVIVPTTVLPPWLESNQNWIFARHRRTEVGVLLPANSKFRVRADYTNTGVTKCVTVRLLNNNRNTELEINLINEQWVEVEHEHENVPFVDWPVGEKNSLAEVHFEFDGPYTPLPVYVFNITPVNDFKSEYGQSASGYCVLYLKLVCILVPPASKSAVLETNIYELYQFYNEIINYYDTLCGMVGDPYADTIDSNIPNKAAFVKADAGGPGGSYYGPFWTASASASLDDYIKVSPTNWMVLHELGHAYDFVFTVNTGLGETWSNSLCDRLQHTWLNKTERQQLARVYENKRSEVEAIIQALIDESVPFDNWGLFEKLTVFTWLYNPHRGLDTLRNINCSYRLHASRNPPTPYPQIWAWLMSSGYDNFWLYFNLVGLFPADFYMNEHNKVVNYNLHMRALALAQSVRYPIKYIITDFDLLQNNYNIKQYLESNFDLVIPRELKQTNLVADVTVVCVIDDMSQIAGEQFSLYDGEERVFQSTVSADGIMYLVGVGPGVYTLRAPRGKNKRYKLQLAHSPTQPVHPANNYMYLLVTHPYYNQTLTYTPYIHSDLAVDTAHLFGKDGTCVATIYFNILEQHVTVYLNNTRAGRAHNSSVYFEMIISDLFENYIQNFTLLEDNVTMRQGYYKFTVAHENVITLTVTANNTLMLVDQYLPIGLSILHVLPNQLLFESSIYDTTFVRIREQANFLENHKQLLYIENELRDSIYLASQFVDSNSNEFLKYYPDFYRDPHTFIYLFRFRDFASDLLLDFQIVPLLNLASVRINNITIGSDFVNFKAEVFDTNGVVVFSYSRLDTTTPMVHEQHKFEVYEDYIIHLFVQEPGDDRLQLIVNKVLDTTLPHTQNIYARLTHNRLVVGDQSNNNDNIVLTDCGNHNVKIIETLRMIAF